jgi:DUF4097 and DUF4098 domain-containing protein YvlB
MGAKRAVPTLLAGLLILALAACDEFFDFDFGNYRYRFSDSYEADLDGVDRVSITIVNGYIDVKTWEVESVDIEVEERIKAPDEERAEEIAKDVRLDGHRIGSELRIEIDYGDSYHLRRNYACNIDVKVPAGVELELETTNGRIDVARMDKDVRAGTTNGSVHLDGCRGGAVLTSTNGKVSCGQVEGRLSASTTNGSIEIEGASGDVDASTTNGGISLEIDKDAGCTISASTTNGHVEDDLPSSRFDAEYNRRHTTLKGRYLDGRNRIELRTTNGGIRISER